MARQEPTFILKKVGDVGMVSVSFAEKSVTEKKTVRMEAMRAERNILDATSFLTIQIPVTSASEV